MRGVIGVLTGRGPACDELQEWWEREARTDWGRLGLPAVELHVVRKRGNQIAWQRNRVVTEALEASADFVLFVDADVVPPPGAVAALLRRGVPVVSAVCVERVAPFEVCSVRSLEPYARYTVADLKGLTALLPVVAAGAGCLLVRRAVFEAMRAPWFRCGQISPELLSEDLDFCLRAAEHGFPVHLDPTVRAGHSVEGIIWPGDDGEHWVQWSDAAGRAPYRQMLWMGDAEYHE